MKFLIVSLALVFGVSAFAKEKIETCIPASDLDNGFQRCETNEVICYLSKAGQQCWPKPQPAKQADAKAPEATPAPAQAAKVKKVKK